MNGKSKLIGCSSTYTSNLTQCFTKLYKQKTPSKETVLQFQKSDPTFAELKYKEVQERYITQHRMELILPFVVEAVG
jgi:hypothetical protein